jgi:hypothetical protein
MSAAIDAVDFGVPRGGVLSLSVDLRSTRSKNACPDDSPAWWAGRAHVAHLNSSTSRSLDHPFSGCRQQAYGDRARAHVELRGAGPAAGAETIDAGNGAAEWMRQQPQNCFLNRA